MDLQASILECLKGLVKAVCPMTSGADEAFRCDLLTAGIFARGWGRSWAELGDACAKRLVHGASSTSGASGGDTMGAKWHVEKEAHTFDWFKILVVMQAAEIEITFSEISMF